jgi:hypothetical protein
LPFRLQVAKMTCEIVLLLLLFVVFVASIEVSVCDICVL